MQAQGRLGARLPLGVSFGQAKLGKEVGGQAVPPRLLTEVCPASAVQRGSPAAPHLDSSEPAEPEGLPATPGAGARPLGLLRVRGLPSPPTHSELGGRPPEPFHRPRGRAWGVSRGPRWSKLIITAHCTASVGGSHWTRSGTAAVPNSRGLLPGPPHSSAPAAPPQLPPLPGACGSAAFGPLSLSRTGGGEGKHLGEGGPLGQEESRDAVTGPGCGQQSALRQRREPRHRDESRGQPPSVTERRAAGWAPEEGGPEAVARETAVLSQSAPAIRLGGGGPSMGRCCPLVVDGGAGGPGPSLPSGQLEAPLRASLGQGAECLRLRRVSQPSCTSRRLPFVGVSLTCCPTSQGKLLAGNRS